MICASLWTKSVLLNEISYINIFLLNYFLYICSVDDGHQLLILKKINHGCSSKK